MPYIENKGAMALAVSNGGILEVVATTLVLFTSVCTCLSMLH
jgi:hypothetical protein